MSDYVFQGEVIKLNARDYYRFADKFKFVNMVEELEELDFELECKKRDGLSIKNWFSSLAPRLNGRNQRAKNNSNVRQINDKRKQSNAGRSADQTRQILTNIQANSTNNGALGSNGSNIRLTMDTEAGREAGGDWAVYNELHGLGREN